MMTLTPEQIHSSNETIQKLLKRAMEVGTSIAALINVIPVAQEGVRQQALDKHEAVVRAMSRTLEKMAGALSDDVIEQVRREIPNPLIELELRTAELMRASVLVFTHSFVDGAIVELLSLAVRNEPELWRAEIIKQRKRDYSSTQFFTLDRQAEFASALDHFVNTLGHKSLWRRSDALFEAIGDDAIHSVFKPFRMSSDEIREFDDLRHRIVHAGASTEDWAVPRSVAMINHLFYLTICLTARYGQDATLLCMECFTRHTHDL